MRGRNKTEQKKKGEKKWNKEERSKREEGRTEEMGRRGKYGGIEVEMKIIHNLSNKRKIVSSSENVSHTFGFLDLRSTHSGVFMLFDCSKYPVV